MKHQKRPHRAGVVLLGVILVQASIFGILMNCTGIVFSAIIADLGLRTGDLSVYYMVRSFASAATVTLTSRWVFRRGGRGALTMLGLLYAGSVFAMGWFNNLWQWYLSGAVAGVGMSCILVVMPVVLNNWFQGHNGLVIGLAMSASGLAGAIFSPVVADVIAQVGWRQAAILMGLVAEAAIFVAGVVLLRISPCEADIARLPQKEKPAKAAIEPPRAMPSIRVFFITSTALASMAAITQLMNQLPIFSAAQGYSLSVGAVLTSFSMVGNVAGKLLYGVLADRIGVVNSLKIIVAVVASALLLFLIFPASTAILAFASLLLGSTYSVGTIIPALLIMSIYGRTHYQKISSRSQIVSGLTGAVAGILFPYLYDWTGTFHLTWLFALLLCAVSSLCIFLLGRPKIMGVTGAQGKFANRPSAALAMCETSMASLADSPPLISAAACVEKATLQKVPGEK
ncbi:MAG: MFS transporter [Oscillospiraceae bacterium]